MGHHSTDFTHSQLNYSFEYWLAGGIHHFRRNQLSKRHATVGSANFLLKRWNGEALQANLYAVVGAGKSELTGKPEDVGMGMLHFDIEDREYYFLTHHLVLKNKDVTEMEETKVRVGVAPYIADFKGIHSWFILDYTNTKFAGESKKDDLTPFLRIFHNNVLFEIGQSFEGSTKFNYIIHF